MASIVDDRNDLIHHLLPIFNPDSISSCLEVDHYLDKQCEKFFPEFDLLHNMVESLQEGKRILAEFLTSKAGKEFLLQSLPTKNPVVRLLVDIAAQKARSDGRIPLSIAGQIIKQHAPDEISALPEKFGSKTLKALVLATELFELCKEATVGGGIRVLFRLKSDAHFNE
jgi:hypothetical protein